MILNSKHVVMLVVRNPYLQDVSGFSHQKQNYLNWRLHHELLIDFMYVVFDKRLFSNP